MFSMSDYNRDRGGSRGGGFRRGGFDNRNDSRSQDRGFDRGSDRPQMHQATCDKCGKSCEVPFKPTSGKPVFCRDCFDRNGNNSDSRRPSSGGRSFDRPSFEDRRMYDAVCSSCGNDCKLPFQPSPDKEVFCSNCFEKKQNDSGDRRDSGERRERPSAPREDRNAQLDMVNAKLDKILKLLSPETDRVTMVEEVVEQAPVEDTTELVVEAPKKKARVSKKTTAVS